MSGVPPSLAALERALAHPGAGDAVVAGRPATWGRRAAVAILFWAEWPDASAGGIDGLRLVLVEKSPRLRKHAGQLAFPGGGIDAEDPSVEAAALREAHEEVGIEPHEVDVLGVLPPALVAVTGYHVTPVVGWWRTPRPLVAVDTVEVAAVHSVAVRDLVDPAQRVTWRHPLGHSGPAFAVGDLYIWGFTGDLLDGLLRVAGWERPWDPARHTEIPRRFFRGPDTGR